MHLELNVDQCVGKEHLQWWHMMNACTIGYCVYHFNLHVNYPPGYMSGNMFTRLIFYVGKVGFKQFVGHTHHDEPVTLSKLYKLEN